MRTTQIIRAAGAMLLLAWSAAAQQTIKIWPGVAPGSENWVEPESVMKGTDTDRVMNVVTPTLIAYLPEKSKATGTAIIIAPGGGFSYLAIDKEGHHVATWLQERGIAGFVLKYRVRQMAAADIAAFQARRATGAVGGRAGAPAPNAAARPAAPAGGARSMDNVGQYGIADGIQALKLLRQRAAEFGLSPDRIGIAGFSAGAMVASGVLLQQDASSRPAFAAPIYGGPFGEIPAIPQNLPPIFMAWAQDDTTAGAACARFYAALTASGSTPEVHIYRAGGHGFGMTKQNTTSDHWIDEFYYWLEAQGFTKPAAK